MILVPLLRRGLPKHAPDPVGRTVTYAPSGHGLPRRARVDGTDYAANAVYPPSGQPISIDWANAVSLEAVVNARQQVTYLRYASPAQTALDCDYTYDALGRATFIDFLIWSSPTRSHAYRNDALGRLVSASGEWGAGRYTYDLLNNLREKALGLRTVELQYDASGRLNRYRDTGEIRSREARKGLIERLHLAQPGL